MEFRRLRYFIAVAEELSFTRAAERLHTSQPSLSEQIRCLEESLGLVLLTRSPRKVELTEVGRIFLEESRLVLRQVEFAVARAKSAGDQARESLTIGFVPSAEVQIFPVVVPALRLQHPRVQVTLKSLTPPEQLSALSHGDIDVAFTRPPLTAKAFRSEIVLSDTLRVFIRDDHRLASQPAIAPNDLNQVPHVSTDPSYSGALRQVADDYLQHHEVQVGEEQISSNILTSMNLVAGGFGFALLPAYAETFSPRNVVSRPLWGTAPTVDLVMAHAKDANSISPALATLMELVRNIARPSA